MTQSIKLQLYLVTVGQSQAQIVDWDLTFANPRFDASKSVVV
jgi:hypothetical protein